MSLEMDLQDMGHDVESGILRERTWRWLNVRISDAVNNPDSRLRRAILADHAAERRPK